MSTTKRLPRAPSRPLAALMDFLQPFQDQFRSQENCTALERYLTELLTDHPHKNCDTLATVVLGTSEQRLQGLLTTMQWDTDALNRVRVERMLELPTKGDAVLIFDDTGFLKQGRSSVVFARQYSGTIGKVANCQVTVNCHYAERTIARLMPAGCICPRTGLLMPRAAQKTWTRCRRYRPCRTHLHRAIRARTLSSSAAALAARTRRTPYATRQSA